MTRAQLGRFGELLPRFGFSRRMTPTGIGLAAAMTGSWWINHRGVAVWSTLVDAKAPVGPGNIPQWHLSVTAGHLSGQRLRRPSAEDLRDALAAFRVDQWEIDNHHPGNALHVWVPVDPDRRAECECKDDEMIVVEADGYSWTTPRDGPCRGCEFEKMTGRPCPIPHDEGVDDE